jgi:UDP-N-acetylglucosamine 2-epimerase
MFQRFSPKVLVVGNDLTPEGRAAAILAKDYDVGTATLMHGAMGSNPMNALYIVDELLVYGEKHRRDLLSFGLSAERIRVCGAPHLDAKLRVRRTVSSKIQSFLNLKPGEQFVLIATSGPGHTVSLPHHQTLIRTLMELSVAMPEVKFVAKLHRKDKTGHYSIAQSQTSNSRLIVIPSDDPALPSDIFEWFQGASILLTNGSTTAIEAMSLDMPVITMDFADELGHIDFINEGATLHATSPEELRMRLEDVLLQSEKARQVYLGARNFVKGQFISLDGKASVRCADSIIELTRSTSQMSR